MKKNASIGSAGGYQLCVHQIVGVVDRLFVEQAHLVEFGYELQFDLGIAAAGFNVAHRAVGVQPGAGAESQVLCLVVGVDEVLVFAGLLVEERAGFRFALIRLRLVGFVFDSTAHF